MLAAGVDAHTPPDGCVSRTRASGRVQGGGYVGAAAALWLSREGWGRRPALAVPFGGVPPGWALGHPRLGDPTPHPTAEAEGSSGRHPGDTPPGLFPSRHRPRMRVLYSVLYTPRTVLCGSTYVCTVHAAAGATPNLPFPHCHGGAYRAPPPPPHQSKHPAGAWRQPDTGCRTSLTWQWRLRPGGWRQASAAGSPPPRAAQPTPSSTTRGPPPLPPSPPSHTVVPFPPRAAEAFAPSSRGEGKGEGARGDPLGGHAPPPQAVPRGKRLTVGGSRASGCHSPGVAGAGAVLTALGACSQRSDTGEQMKKGTTTKK